MKIRDDFSTYGVWIFGNFVECGKKRDAKEYQSIHGGILITRDMLYSHGIISWEDNIK